VTIATPSLPNLWIRAGRLAGSISIELKFIVDNSTKGGYPGDGPNCQECKTGINLNLTTFIALNLHTEHTEKGTFVKGILHDVTFPRVDVLENPYKIAFDLNNFMATLSNMISSMTPLVDALLIDGFLIPPIPLISDLTLIMVNGFLALSADLVDNLKEFEYSG